MQQLRLLHSKEDLGATPSDAARKESLSKKENMMSYNPQEVTILLAEDDDAHVALTERNLQRAGISNRIMRFRDGQETLDFLGIGDPVNRSGDTNRGRGQTPGGALREGSDPYPGHVPATDVPTRRDPGRPYLLLLDIRMPKVDGVEVLRRVKADPELYKMPVIMITTTDDPVEVERCHKLGCNSYVTKPVAYAGFVEAVRRLGQFLQIVKVPALGGEV